MTDRRTLERGCWALVLLLAAALRLLPIRAALPYMGYVDEGHVLHPVITLLRTGGVDPGVYMHPTLTGYLIALGVNAYRPVYHRLVRGHSLFFDLPEGDTLYDDVSPPELILIGRLVAAALSLATVLLAGALARRLGGPAAGVLAGLLTALCPALVSRGSIVIVDTTAAFCVTAALLAARLLEEEPGSGRALRLALIGGACSGLALTAKYTSAPVLLAVTLTALLRDETPRRRLALCAAACGAGALAVALTMPPLVLRPRAVAEALLLQGRYYSDTSLYSPNNTDVSYLRQLVSAQECGWTLALAALAGAGLMFVRHRRTLVSYAAFALLFLVPLVLHPYRPFRQLLPLVPVLCAAAALPLSALLGSRKLLPLGAAATLAVTVPMAIGSVRQVRARRALQDTRTTAVDWLAANTGGRSRVLVERELAVLPAELRRIHGQVVVAGFDDICRLAAVSRFDYLLAAPLGVWGEPRPGWAATRDAWNAWLASMAPAGSIGHLPTPVYPNFWRENHQIMTVYRGADAQKATRTPFSCSARR